GCDVTPSRDSGGSSGGSGGGGVITGEPFDNQKSHETKEKNLRAGQPVLYPFTQVEDGIHEISVTGKENEDNVALRIEYLKGLSRNVKDPAPGNVNYYFNLWAGTKKIKSAVIRFSVDNSWLSSNNIAASDLKLLKWDGTKWIQLDTTQTSSDAKHTYYEGGTDSFSSFAITGLNAAGVSSTPPSEATPAQTAQAGTPEATATPGTVPSTNLWLIAVVIIVLVAAAVVYLKGRK
ncbi:MAG: PGF-pre-PGF domain-containing protein, partial [Euryarchaeota archaeon]|nr:PGF-pre-PGF domain-containing protein [Euryarchaeota archaeon]